METNQRGFLLTERSIRLDAYKHAEKTLLAVMDEASRLVAGSPQQHETVARLQRVVTDRLDEVHSTIDEEHAGRPPTLWTASVIKRLAGRLTCFSSAFAGLNDFRETSLQPPE